MKGVFLLDAARTTASNKKPVPHMIEKRCNGQNDNVFVDVLCVCQNGLCKMAIAVPILMSFEDSAIR